MRLCSACLLGFECRYDGKSNIDKASDELLDDYRKGNIIPICPEIMGGLSTPRSGARILYGDGNQVLDNKTQIMTDDGEDVTIQYIKGAYEALRLARDLKIREVIFINKSPSCGKDRTQGGLEERSTVKGEGVTAALFRRNGIRVMTEKEV
ncbi:DUF523 domain-containing protein [Candidatus Woesearchaeota archaeon]|nr:DUF523 domain-containing protein [Candidatus Woesearchaeota archaeon]